MLIIDTIACACGIGASSPSEINFNLYSSATQAIVVIKKDKKCVIYVKITHTAVSKAIAFVVWIQLLNPKTKE